MACSMSRASAPRHSPTTIRSHAQRIGDKLSNGDRPAALGIGKTRFESDDVRMLIESEFGAVLDCDDALFVGDKAR